MGGEKAAQTLRDLAIEFFRSEGNYTLGDHLVIRVYVNGAEVTALYKSYGILGSDTDYLNFVQGFNTSAADTSLIDTWDNELVVAKLIEDIKVHLTITSCASCIFGISPSSTFKQMLLNNVAPSNNTNRVKLVGSLEGSDAFGGICPTVWHDGAGLFRTKSDPLPSCAKEPEVQHNSTTSGRPQEMGSLFIRDIHAGAVASRPQTELNYMAMSRSWEALPNGEILPNGQRVIFQTEDGLRVDIVVPAHFVDQTLIHEQFLSRTGHADSKKVCNRNYLLTNCPYTSTCKFDHSLEFDSTAYFSLLNMARSKACIVPNCVDPLCMAGHQCIGVMHCRAFLEGRCKFSDARHKPLTGDIFIYNIDTGTRLRLNPRVIPEAKLPQRFVISRFAPGDFFVRR